MLPNTVAGTGDPFDDDCAIGFARLPIGMTVHDLATLFARPPARSDAPVALLAAAFALAALLLVTSSRLGRCAAPGRGRCRGG